VGDPPQEALARLGFILDMKVERNSESFYIFGHLLEFFFFQNLANLGFFFFLKVLYIVEIILCRLKFGETSPKLGFSYVIELTI